MKKDKSWNPYLAGALAGLLFILSVLIAGHFFGASTTYIRSAGMIEKIFSAQRIARIDYFTRYAPGVDWQFMFLIGIFLGALIASVTSGSFRWQAVPDMWKARFGSSVVKRGVAAFIGGLIAIFGARLAGGCLIDQGLSGLIQLSLSGIVSLVCFFTGGIVTAYLLYRGGGQK